MSLKRFIPLLILLFVSLGAKATLVPHNTVVLTGSMNSGITSITPPGWSLTPVDLTRKGIITLGIDHHFPNYVAQSVTEVTITIAKYTSYSALTPSSTENRTLIISYYPLDSLSYQDEHTITIDNVEKMEITVTDIKVNGVSQSPMLFPANVYLQGDVFVDRVYDFLPQVDFDTYDLTVGEGVNIDCDINEIKDEVTVSWDLVPGAEEYQLEWTFINTIDVAIGDVGDLEVDFHMNSTRISTKDLSYKISLLFDKGIICFRVRAVGRSIVDESRLLFSEWSTGDGLVALSTIPAAAKYTVDEAFDVKKNWQYTATYAEEGKKKEVVSFYDGSLRNRQMVTKINTDHNAIVGETIYDHQGRPAVQVLPVPVTAPDCELEDTENSLMYYPDFNKNHDGLVPYTKADFDVTASGSDCNAIPVGSMNTNSGASNYYSPDNLNKAGSQAYVPDAEEYPFSQVEYMPDNTGRIRRQGGVGDDFQLGSNHESFYFYAHPFQEQLDRLFGSEVGDATHYQKNMVVDPNGQVSVSYLDQEGRVVATSLAGQAPNNLSALPSLGSIAPLTVDLFQTDAQRNSTSNKLSSDGMSKVFNQTIALSAASDVEISYDILIEPFENDCLGELCLNCVYDLSIEVKNLCGELESPIALSKKMIGRFITEVNGDITFKTDCANFSDASNTFLIEDLPLGTYQISKKLTVNQEALDAYMAMYTDTSVHGINTCINNYEEILDQVGESSNIDDCLEDFSCAECVTNLGSLLEYIDAGGTEEQYKEELIACNAPCKGVSFYENMRNILLTDVKPNGQYGEYLNNQNGVQPTLYPVSVLNEGNFLPKRPDSDWRFPQYDVEATIQNYYFDEDGTTRSKIKLEDVTVVSNSITASIPAVQGSLTLGNEFFLDPITGEYYTYPQYLANLTDFVEYYSVNPYWANSLVIYHPEYPYLKVYKEFYVKANPSDPYSSESFDDKMIGINTWSLAQSEGFINSMSGAVNARVNHFWDTPGSSPGAFLRDPFGLANAALNAKIMNYVVINGVTYSMMQAAAMTNRGGNNLVGNVPVASDLDLFADVLGNTPTQNLELRNAEWMTFRGMYLAAKQQIQQELAEDIALDASNPDFDPGYNGCIGNESFYPFTKNFLHFNPFGIPIVSGQYMNPDQPCAHFTDQYYTYKAPRFGNYLVNIDSDPSQVAYQQYLLTGQCPIAVSFQHLLTQAANTDVLDDTGFPITLNTLSGLILSMQDFQLPVSIPSLTWIQIPGPSNTLEVHWEENGSPFAEFLLEKASGATYNWSDILSFGNLHFTTVAGSLYEFIIEAKVSVGGVITTELLTGNTSLKIGNCVFPPVCNKNDFGFSLHGLMNSLAQMNTLSSASLVDISVAPYDVLMNNPVKYTVNPTYTTGDPIKWKYNSALPGFELTDLVKTINIKITAISPSSFTLSSLSSVRSITELNAGPNNTMDIVCYDAFGNYLATLSCDLVRSDNVMIPVGKCGLDDAILCTGLEYETYHDLIEVLEFSLENQNAPFNLFNTPLWTSTLDSQLESSPVSITGTVSLDSILTYNFPGDCEMILTYSGSSPNFDFDNIVSVDNVKLIDQNYYGSFNGFRLYITYTYGGNPYQDSIDGISCFKLKACTSCTYIPASVGSLGSEGTDGIIDLNSLDDDLITHVDNDSELYCLDMYEDYVSAYGIFVANQLLSLTCADYETLYPLMTYEEFVDKNLCCEGHMYTLLNFMANFVNTTTCPYNIADLGSCPELNMDSCSNSYARLLTYIDYFENSPWALANGVSLPVPGDGCECQMNYSAYLFEYITAAADENLPHPLSMSDYCALLNGEPQNNCSSKYDKYVSAMEHYNAESGPGAPFPIIDYDAFMENSLCYCIDAYCSELNLILDELKPGPPQDLFKFCLGEQQIPCVTDTPLVHFDSFETIITDPCTDFYQSNNEVNAQIAYNEQLQNFYTQLGEEYIKHCMNALENMSMTYNELEHHFTLYYYDQAGNLIKTIPPEGVEFVDITNTSVKNAIKADRLNKTHQVITNHRMATTYLYNSLNQLVAQNMPDQDPMNVFEPTLPNGLPVGLSTTAIQMVDANQGYLAGYTDASTVPLLNRGYLFKTTNGGLNWVRVNNTLGADLKEIKMASSTIGYALATNGLLLLTKDNGASWDLVNTPSIDPAEYRALEVVGTDAYVLNAAGTILKFTSAGVSSTYLAAPTGTYPVADWKDFTLQGNTANKQGIVYLVTLTETPVSYDAVIVTNNAGGTTFDIDNTQVSSFSAVSFINATDAIVAGEDGNISLINGASGSYKQQLKLSGTAGLIDQIFMLDASKGIARITENGVRLIRKTVDGGLTWTSLDENYTNATLTLVRRNATSLEVMVHGNTGAPENKCYTKNILITSAGVFGEIDQTPSLAQTYTFDIAATYNDGTNITYFAIGLDGSNYKLYRSNSFTSMNADVTYVPVATLGASSIVPKEMVIVKSGSNVRVEVLSVAGVVYTSTAALGAGSYPTFAAVSGASNTNIVSIDKITVSSLDYVLAFRSSDNYLYAKAATTAGPFYYYANAVSFGGTVNKLVVHGSNVTLIGTNGGIFTSSAIALVPASDGAVAITFTDRKQHRLTALTKLRATASGITVVGQNGQVFTRPLSTSASTLTLRPIGSISNVHTSNEYVSSSVPYFLVGGADGLLVTITLSPFTVEPVLYTTTNVKVSDHSYNKDINDIAVSGTSVYLVGESGSLYYTPNIVTDFFTPAVSQTAQNFLGVDFLVGQTTKALTSGTGSEIFKFNTTFGAKVNQIYGPKFNDVHFENGQFGTIVGDYYFVRSTVDGGMSWKINVTSTSMGVNGLTKVWTKSGPTGNHYAIIGAVNYLLQANNGVVTETALSGTVNDIQFSKSDPLFGYLAYNDKLAKITLSTSYSYTLSSPGYTAANTIRGIHVFGNNSAIMVGDGGDINYFRYDDGTSYTLETVSGVTFRDVYFLDDKIGLAVGNAGKVYSLRSVDNDNVTHDLLSTNFNATDQTVVDPLSVSAALYNLTAIAFSSTNRAIYGGNFLTIGNANSNQAMVRYLKFESGLFSGRFYYDRLGRIVASQNTRQTGAAGITDDKYSYTLYDALGRVYEAGEKTENGSGGTKFPSVFGTNVGGTTVPNVIDDTKLGAWLDYTAATTRKEVTKSYYDGTNPNISAEVTSLSTLNPFTQRKRIVHVTYAYFYSADANEYDHATHYDYDIHGNVKTLYQDNRSIKDMVGIGDHRLKRMDYIYDLISGNVHRVDYQTGSADQWHHAYSYDADNRITDAYTTVETPLTGVNSSLVSLENEPELSTLWDREVSYEYYDHGPLARTILGDQEVQGIDNVYTLQGWIKSINSNTLDLNRDPGEDGVGLSDNHAVARDVYGYSLHYFEGDYPGAIGGNNSFVADQSGSDMVFASTDLYNGNIGRMVTTITDPNNRDVLPLGNGYFYDQLNRLMQSKSYTNLNFGTNNWGSGQTEKYRNDLSYDANGNIMTQWRRDDVGNLIDRLTYKYKDVEGNIGTTNPKMHNRLYYVHDTQNYDGNDIDPGQAATNYTYDAEGRLIGDEQEKISAITWRVDGKVKKVTRTSGYSKKNVSFDYDAMGHRIAKHIYTDADLLEKSTYYVLDAQGNTMSVYERIVDSEEESVAFDQTEKHMYGSSRIGLHGEKIALLGTENDDYSMESMTHHIGDKNYELMNHLGNVLSVVSDKVIPKSADIQVLYNNDFSSSYSPFLSNGTITMSISSGRLKAQNASVSNSIRHNITTTTGHHYRITCTLDLNSSGNLLFYARNTPTATNIVLLTVSSNGTYSIEFDAQSTSTQLIVANTSGTTRDYYVDDFIIEDITVTGYMADIRQATDYSPFGVKLKNRDLKLTPGYGSITPYRYSFQGQEHDDEVKGAGNSINFEYRMHDPRIGRFFAIDPLAAKYPFYSPYAFSGNRVIDMVELEGLEPAKPKEAGAPKLTPYVELTIVEEGAAVAGESLGTRIGMGVLGTLGMVVGFVLVPTPMGTGDMIQQPTLPTFTFKPLTTKDFKRLFELEGRSLSLNSNEKSELFNLQGRLRGTATGVANGNEMPLEAGDANQGRNMALDLTGLEAGKARWYVGRLGLGKGKKVGLEKKDDAGNYVRYRYDIDYDAENKVYTDFHINVEKTFKDGTTTKYRINIPGGKDAYLKKLKELNN